MAEARCRSCHRGVRMAEMVRFHPCDCCHCKDCTIQLLAQTLIGANGVLRCRSCGLYVAAHRLVLPTGRVVNHKYAAPATVAASNANVAAGAAAVDQRSRYPMLNRLPAATVATGTASIAAGRALQDTNGSTTNVTTNQKQPPPSKAAPASVAATYAAGAGAATVPPAAISVAAGTAALRDTSSSTTNVMTNRKQSPPATGKAAAAPKRKLLITQGRTVAISDRTSPAKRSKYEYLYPPRKYKTFDERFSDLLLFKKRHGHCIVPWVNSEGKTSSLAEWVRCIRCGRLKVTPEQRQRLDDIGFCWEKKKDADWKAMFVQLQAYKEKFGDVRVPWEWAQGLKLSRWVHTQRKEYSKGKIRKDRKELLDSIGMVWRPSADRGGGGEAKTATTEAAAAAALQLQKKESTAK